MGWNSVAQDGEQDLAGRRDDAPQRKAGRGNRLCPRCSWENDNLAEAESRITRLSG